MLSQAGKEILIKAVAQTSPTAVVMPETVKSGLTHREAFSQSVAPTKLHSPSLPRPTQVEHPLTNLNTSSGVQSGVFTSHPKLKTFTWSAWRNILPTKVNLCHRGVLEDATCEACQLDEETSGHLFWHCTRAIETWVIGACVVSESAVLAGSTLGCRPSKSSRSHMSDDKATNQLTLWLSTPKDLTLLYRG